MAPIPKPAAPALPARRPPTAAPVSPTSFPISACGPHLASAITAVAACTQAAPELVAHHLLTLAAMAAQRLVAVRLPTGRTQPVSAYFLTIAGSGEGRSAAENMCVGPVRFWRQRFAGKGAFEDEHGRRLEPKHHITIHLDEEENGEVTEFSIMGPVEEPAPAASKAPDCDDVFLSLHRAGVNDRYDRYARFGRRGGLFAAVAADLLAPSTARRNEADSLSALWDGGLIPPGGASAGLAPRLSAHLVAAQREALAFLGSPEVADSGLFGRVLAVRPASRIGARLFRESDGAPPPDLTALHARLTDLYARAVPFEPRAVALDADARALWLAFAQEVEAAMGEGGAFADVRGLAGRLAEHAARLAAVIALVDDADLTALTPAMLERGLALARFYADEALRLARLRESPPDENDPLVLLQDWLARKYAGQEVTLREVYSDGPAAMRSAAAAMRAMRQLELLGVAEPLKKDKGNPRTARWRVPAPGEAGPSPHNAA